MKKMFYFLTMVFTLMVSFACSSDENDYWGDGNTTTPKDTVVIRDTVIVSDTIVVDDTLVIRTPVYVDVVDGDTIMRDGDGGIIRIRPDKFIATITCQDTVVVSADKPWTLSSYQENPQTPLVDYIIGVSTWVYNHRTLSAKDSIRGEFRGRTLPLYPGAKRTHEVEEFEEVVTDTTTSRNVHYVLYIRDNVMRYAPQVQGTTTSNIEVEKLFVHKAFRPNATVSGENIAIICDNTASFGNQAVNYLVTNNFTFVIPDYISAQAKGNTYLFEGSTATVEGKNVTVSFANRVVSDIIFNNVNYKDNVPQCEITVKSIKFGENTAIITFVHDNETVTAEVPVRYNYVTKYELVGNSTHDIWHNVTGSGTSFAMTCDNHVVVKEIWADGSEGETFELPYVSTNEWSVDNTTIVVENKNSIIGVREEIVDGSVTLEGNSLNFNHSMKAESVSKGTFTYQPTPCEAVARYITVTSNTTAVVEIYDDNIKIGEYTLPINVIEIIKIKGNILAGVISDSYPIHVGSKETWEHIVTSKSGKYYHYYCPENETINNTTEPTEYTTIGILTQKQNYAFWYDNSGKKYLGYVEAVQIGQDKEDNLLVYKTMDDQTAYLLGEGEKTLQEKFRYPILATLHKVVIGSRTLWTFNGSKYYQDGF